MNLGYLVGTAEITAALGVIATLGYLACQISQTNRIAKSTVASDLMQKYNEFLAVVLANSEISKLASKLTDPTFVPEPGEEADNTENFANLLCNLWFSAQAAYDQGQIDNKDYGFYSLDVVARLKQWPAARPFIRRVLERYPGMESFSIYAPIFDLDD